MPGDNDGSDSCTFRFPGNYSGREKMKALVVRSLGLALCLFLFSAELGVYAAETEPPTRLPRRYFTPKPPQKVLPGQFPTGLDGNPPPCHWTGAPQATLRLSRVRVVTVHAGYSPPSAVSSRLSRDKTARRRTLIALNGMSSRGLQKATSKVPGGIRRKYAII